MSNIELAQLFYEMAKIYEIRGINWKPQAYKRAAQSIETLPKEITEIYKKGGTKELKKIPGVGRGIAKKIEEYINKGKISELERLKKTIPKSMTQMLAIPGVGPKTVKILSKKLKIKSIDGLLRAAKKHTIRKLEGFDEKTEKNIIKGIELMKSKKDRQLIGFVFPLANNVIKELKKQKFVEEVRLAGSMRRGKETVKDIDILVVSKKPEQVMNLFTKLKSITKVTAKGKTRASAILSNLIQIDIRVVPKKSFGSSMQYFTGNKQHSVQLREIARKKGYKLNEYGLFTRKGNKNVASKHEKDIYKKLGLQFIPPELRQGRGEIELAKKNKLPKLIQDKDIKGDLHVHSTYSDGENTVLEMVQAAKNLNYKYVGIADHSPMLKVFGGIEKTEISKKIKEINNINKKIKGIKVLCNAEVDIHVNGKLDYEDKILKKFDIVIGSVHRSFTNSKSKNTKRVITALENKYLKILGHPQGRSIGKRTGLELDWDQVFDVAKEKKKILEINAQPKRLDLNYIFIKKAIEKKVKLCINTDAHTAYNLKNIRLGVMQAQRGWAEKKDIINTKNYKDLAKLLKLSR